MLANCIVSTFNIGNTVAYNLCNGTSQVIPWGTATWLSHGVTLAFFAGLGYFTYVIVRDVKIEVEKITPKKKT